MVESKKKKISISFSEKYTDIYAYLKTKDNISSYICELIKKDIDSPNEDDVLTAKIEEVVERILKDKKFTYQDYPSEEEENSSLSNEDVDVILGLF